MRDFDYQWKNLPDKNIEYNDDRIKEFLVSFFLCQEIYF